MSNSLLTDAKITQECLMQLKNELVLSNKVNRQYSNQFAETGAKIGDNLNIRKPSRYTVTDGAVLEVQDSQDQYVNLQVSNQKHVGMAFTSKDRALSLDRFSERYIQPAMTALANQVDFSLYLAMYQQTYHSVGIPSATALPSTMKGFGQARAKIAKSGAPIDKLNSIVDFDVEASLVSGQSSLFNSQDSIGEQYKKGSMGYASGMQFFASQNVYKHTIGALGGTPLVNYPSAYVAGSTSLVTDGWSNSITGVLKAGDVISIAGVNEVNPQTRQSTGALAQFLVTADVNSDGSGNCTIVLDRGLYASGQYQNVDALPANNAAITIFGHASSYAGIVAPQNLVFDKNAYALAVVDLAEMPNSVVKRDEDSGLSIRMWQQGDINNDRLITRLDIMYGFKAIYPEYACRVVGQPA